MTVLAKPTPYQRAEAGRWIPHLATHLDTQILDELIGRCAAEAATPPDRISYLTAAVRHWARTQHLDIPDPPVQP